MNKEDIIRWTREAGGFNTTTEFLERFAHLVYESVFRDANIAASRTILDAAILEEREACAKVCDNIAACHEQQDSHIGAGAAKDCAEIIRARGPV